MKLTEKQQQVLDGITEFALGRAKHGLATLQGYAGVGKTTVVSELLKAVSSRVAVVVTAPTHKALAVLGVKLGDIGCDLMTTHSALGLKLTELDSGEQRLRHDGASCIADYDLAVVDEASMLHPELFAALLSSRRQCRILFVGDPAQLVPVGSDERSAAFSDIVPLHFHLTEVVRQAEEHPSIRMSVMLRKNVENREGPDIAALAGVLQSGDERFISISSGGDAAIRQYALDALKHGLETHILAFTNKATIQHNRAIHASLYPGVDGFAVGERVIAQEGFTHKPESAFGSEFVQVRTSEFLIVEGVFAALAPGYAHIPAWRIEMKRENGGKVSAWVAQDREALESEVSGWFDQWRKYRAEADAASPRDKNFLKAKAKECSERAWSLRNAFANIRHAYALTIHKSQGSTFETVLIDWASMAYGNPEDTSRLAYVAITRPSKYAVIVTK